MKKIVTLACVLVTACALAQTAKKAENKPGKQKATAVAQLKNQKGEDVGEVRLEQAPKGLIARLKVKNIPAGEHAFHIHEVGKCEAPFTSAGGHYNPLKHQHGIENVKGKHAGDLPNLHVPESGELELTFFIDTVTLTGGKAPLFDKDGSAFVIHAGPDDYASDPAGNAGDRIACGVVEKS